MTSTATTGIRGEHEAEEYLRAHGYEICACNWRVGHYELDIVARREGILHFVEVKTRRADSLTPPEAALTAHKFRSLHRAATYYLAYYREQCEVQFDLAAVDILPGGQARVRLIEQAMEYNW